MNIIHKELFIALIYLVSLLSTCYFIKDKKKEKNNYSDFNNDIFDEIYID